MSMWFVSWARARGKEPNSSIARPTSERGSPAKENDHDGPRHGPHAVDGSADQPSGAAGDPGVRLLGRPDQGARERRVEPTRDSSHPLVAKLSERCRWLVVLEDGMSRVVLVKHNADRSIERGGELIPRHQRGRDRIADIILERVTRVASSL